MPTDKEEAEKRGYIIKDWSAPYVIGADYDFSITAAPLDSEFIKWSLNKAFNLTQHSNYKQNQFSLKTKRALK